MSQTSFADIPVATLKVWADSLFQGMNRGLRMSQPWQPSMNELKDFIATLNTHESRIVGRYYSGRFIPYPEHVFTHALRNSREKPRARLRTQIKEWVAVNQVMQRVAPQKVSPPFGINRVPPFVWNKP